MQEKPGGGVADRRLGQQRTRTLWRLVLEEGRISASRQHGRLGDEASCQDRRQPSGMQGFRVPKGKGKSKGCKGDSKQGKGKGHLSDMQNC